MPSAGDFLSHYADCRTHRQAQEVYKSLITENNPMTPPTLEALAESLRLTHQRIVEDREKPATTGIVRIRRDNSDVHDMTVRSWARMTGFVMPRSGRVTNAVRDAYRIAHDMPVPDAPRVSEKQDATISSDISKIRTWAISEGIQVGSRGRIPTDIIQRYKEAHEDG